MAIAHSGAQIITLVTAGVGGIVIGEDTERDIGVVTGQIITEIITINGTGTEVSIEDGTADDN